MLYAVKYNRFPDEDFGSEAGATVRAHHSESTTILTGATSSSHHVSHFLSLRPVVRRDKISNLGANLLKANRISIRLLSSFIGNTVAAAPGVPLAPLRYKRLELARNRALLEARGNYDSLMTLSPQARDTISWWIDNIHSMTKPMFPPQPSYELYCDASLMGWGAKLGQVTTGGHWAESEIAHINVLELKTVLLSLVTLQGG